MTFCFSNTDEISSQTFFELVSDIKPSEDFFGEPIGEFASFSPRREWQHQAPLRLDTFDDACLALSSEALPMSLLDEFDNNNNNNSSSLLLDFFGGVPEVIAPSPPVSQIVALTSTEADEEEEFVLSHGTVPRVEPTLRLTIGGKSLVATKAQFDAIRPTIVVPPTPQQQAPANVVVVSVLHTETEFDIEDDDDDDDEPVTPKATQKRKITYISDTESDLDEPEAFEDSDDEDYTPHHKSPSKRSRRARSSSAVVVNAKKNSNWSPPVAPVSVPVLAAAAAAAQPPTSTPKPAVHYIDEDGDLEIVSVAGVRVSE